jgi:DNA primase
MDFIEHLKSAVDIVRVIGDYVKLRRVGSGPRYVGLCPFHVEKTPSFSVHAQHQFYKCFGCGAGGDVIKFVMEVERLSFWEAVTWLAERNGIPLPKRPEHADEDSRRRGALHEMHELAVQLFRETLLAPQGQEVRAYLARRGVSAQTSEEFSLGLSDRSGQQLVRAFERRGFSHEDMEASGLVLRRQDGSGLFDRFRGRLMFPIHSESGKVIAFGGRALAEGDEPKYLNSSETPIYYKSAVLYNLNRARKAISQHGFTVLVEGYMDVIGVFAAGVENVVASCGTALTPLQVRAMKRHAPAVVINFDPDSAGMRATEEKAQVLLEEGVRLKVLQLTGGLDPDEFIQRHGAQAYSDTLRDASTYYHWLADRARSRFDLRTPEGRVGAFQFLLPAIHRLPDKIERLAVADDLAEYLGVEKGMVLDEFRKAAAGRREARRVERSGWPDPNELLLLNGLLTRAEIRDRITPELRGLDLPALRTGRIVATLLRLIDAGQTPSYTALEARLEENDRNLLACLLEADELLRDPLTVGQAVAILKSLSEQQRQQRRTELRQRIKTAERAGKIEEALQLMKELQTVEKEGGAAPPDGAV